MLDAARLRGNMDHFAVAVADVNQTAGELVKTVITIVNGPFEIGDLMGDLKGLFIHGPDNESIELFQIIGEELSGTASV